jgi:radical SAM superfamily enzyme YgiQ (UPF0313 family)
VSVLLISTYDLGRQPFGLASPAAWLRRAGFEVVARDVSRDALEDRDLANATRVAFYLPMHTATRLALPVIDRIRVERPRVPLCAYGLYAPLNEALLREHGVSEIFGPEAEEDLVGWASLKTGLKTRLYRGRLTKLDFIRPDRSGLPTLDRYATLQMPDGSRRIAGATDASRGCKHRCRHCPIVPIYDGQFRVVPRDVVLGDIDQQVAAGAEHITFGDPDFFNGPTHARRIVEALHARHPNLTYDVTIKVEHLLRHCELLPILADTGCLFITSAVESVDDEILRRFEKNHTRADFEEAVRLTRAAGVALAPTFVAFTPWTTLDGYRDLLNTVDALGLAEHVAPVQWGLRLLITQGSRLLELDDIRARAGAFDRNSLTYPWHHDDPDVDALQAAISKRVGVGNRDQGSGIRDQAGIRDQGSGIRDQAGIRDQGSGTSGRRALFDEIRALAGGVPLHTREPATLDRAAIPYLNEPWYC